MYGAGGSGAESGVGEVDFFLDVEEEEDEEDEEEEEDDEEDEEAEDPDDEEVAGKLFVSCLLTSRNSSTSGVSCSSRRPCKSDVTIY